MNKKVTPTFNFLFERCFCANLWSETV